MNNSPVNRVEADLNQWRSKEERFSKLFSFSLSSNRALLKEKLNYYDRIAAKYKGTQDLDERFALRVLRQERKRIEKQLYPNLLIRLLRRLLVAPVKEQIVIRQDNRKTEQNSQALHQQVQRSGFPDLSTKIDEQIRQGQQQFSIPVSYYLNDKERLDHQLSFAKDQSGQYHFEGYKTALYNEAKPDEKRLQFFSIRHEHNINTTEAYNLLSGRCIQNRGTWLQLDFNDKEPNGNFRVKQFHFDYGYDLDKALQQLPLKELLNKGETDSIKERLKSGDRISVSFVKDGNEQRFYIEANPQFKSVNIYDEHSRKLTLNTALGNKTMEAMKVTHKVNEQQQQAQKNGMRIR
ncbi:MAG TPA: hypothetical protein VFX43_08905 [Chitinophagaceae bacterium]|nr:hypothetical protein [Chitinophagaceae bacterium]